MFQCKKEDDAPCATYEADIKAIINKTCAYAGCHGGANSAGPFVPAGSKDYTNYAGLKASFDNGTFEDRVIIKANMPNPLFTFNGPKTLTQEEKDIITCWIKAGYPEK